MVTSVAGRVRTRFLRSAAAVAFALTLLGFSSVLTSAQTLDVLYSFSDGTDGGQSYSKLVGDSDGNGYGTTAVGGDLTACGGVGCGVIFKLRRSGQYHVLYTFEGDADGANPWSGLLRDSAGNLYGTTEAGGTAGFGTVFKLAPTGQKTTLYNFQGGLDGAYPFGELVADRRGNLYGTTYKGGSVGVGTVYRVSPSGETVLYSFQGGGDGKNPYAGLVRDEAGNLYGTTYGDGIFNYGTVFKLSAKGDETPLHVFSGGADGGFPFYGSLVIDPGKGLYGTTSFGGAHSYFGTVFRVDRTGQYNVVYSFSGGPDGGQPNTSLIRDHAGNLYGETIGGGNFGHGTIFKVDPAGNESVLYSFMGGADPASPNAPLIRDAAGNLFGASAGGGDFGQGAVFEFTP